MARVSILWVSILLLPLGAAGQSLLYSISQNTNQFRVIDPVTGAAISTNTITLAGATIIGATGLAANPRNGELWALLRRVGFSGRQLAILNPYTGAATAVGGDTNLLFASLAFNSQGTLFAVTGAAGAIPETLYTLNTNTAAPTLFMTLGNGGSGEAIAYHPFGDRMYHVSGTTNDNSRIFESINLSTLTTNGIPLSGSVYVEADAMTFLATNTLLLIDRVTVGATSSRLFALTTNGVVTFRANLDHRSKGLAFVPTFAITNITRNASGHVTLVWNSIGGTRYRVQYSNGDSTGSFNGTFTDIVRSVGLETDPTPAGKASSMSFTDDFTLTGGAPGLGRRYYRIKIVP